MHRQHNATNIKINLVHHLIEIDELIIPTHFFSRPL
jgi:hypothetical protein